MSNDPAIIDEMLCNAKNIAVVGMSDKPHRASYNIGRYLLRKTGIVSLLSTRCSTKCFGGPCYAGLDAAEAAALKKRVLHRPAEESISLTFSCLRARAAIVDNVIRLRIPYLWLQDEVIHDEAVDRARGAGVKAVRMTASSASTRR